MVLLISPALISCGSRADDKDEVAVIETLYGPIVIEFYPDSAPKNVAHFKELVRENFYDGTRFFRIATDVDKKTPLALQGGDPNTINNAPSTWGQGQPNQKTVVGEFTTKYKHERGTVSMMHGQKDPNSATSQFFICIKSAPQLDGQYSIIGHVVEGQGMNVVESIMRRMPQIPADIEADKDPRLVKRIYLIKRDELKNLAAQ